MGLDKPPMTGTGTAFFQMVIHLGDGACVYGMVLPTFFGPFRATAGPLTFLGEMVLDDVTPW